MKNKCRSSLFIVVMMCLSITLAGCDASQIMGILEKALPAVKSLISAFTSGSKSTTSTSTSTASTASTSTSTTTAKSTTPSLEE